MYWIGHEGDAFAFDNESPRHRTFLESFHIGSRLVTCGEYRQFIDDGGYHRPEFWLSQGWNTVQENSWKAPLYWFERDGDWSQFEVMLLAFVIGMLVLPILIDASFYIVLRERFVALHALMVMAMMTSGVTHLLIPPAEFQSDMVMMSWTAVLDQIIFTVRTVLICWPGVTGVISFMAVTLMMNFMVMGM